MYLKERIQLEKALRIHMSQTLSEHIRADERKHGELTTAMQNIGKHIRKWALLGGIMGGILGHAIHALEGCNPALPGRPTALDLASYQNQQTNCVIDYNTKNDICGWRAASKNEWCAHFPKETNCPWNKDGGTE